MEAGRSEVQGHLWLPSELQASLKNIRPYLNLKKFIIPLHYSNKPKYKVPSIFIEEWCRKEKATLLNQICKTSYQIHYLRTLNTAPSLALSRSNFHIQIQSDSEEPRVETYIRI